MLPLAYHVRHLLVRRTTTAATLLGVAAAALVLASSRMATDGLAAAMGSAGRDDVAVLLVKGSESELTSQLEAPAAVRAAALATGAAGVPLESASHETVVTVTVARREGGALSNLVLRGVDATALSLRPGWRMVAGRAADPGADELMIGRAVAGRFEGLGVGDRFEIVPGRAATVTGVFAAGGSATESEIWGPRELVAAATGRKGITSSVHVLLPASSRLAAVRAAVAGYRELDLEATSERELFERQGLRVSMLVQGLGGLVGLLLALAATLGAAVTLHAQVASRRREIAVLRALGWTRSAVLLSFLAEGLLLAGAGGALGAAGALLLDGSGTSLVNVASYTEVRVTLLATPAALLTALALAVGVGLAGALVPAVRAALVKPSSGMRRD